MKHYHLIFYVALAFLLTCCQRDKKNPYRHSPLTKIQKTKWNIDDAIHYFGLKKTNTKYIQSVIKAGLFRPEDSCYGYIIIKPAITFNSGEKEIKTIFKQASLPVQLLKIRDYLYSTIPELYLDKPRNYDFNYSITPRNVLLKIQEGKRGELAAQCAEYAYFTKNLWEYYNPGSNNSVIKIFSMNTDSNYTVSHVICLFYFIEENETYGVIVDAMYGYVYPLNENGGLVPVEQLMASYKDKNMSYKLNFSEDSILRKKRFLTNKIWPCNVVNDSAEYYFGGPNALRKYELHEPENIRLLNIENYSQANYEKDLARIIIENKPLSRRL